MSSKNTVSVSYETRPMTPQNLLERVEKRVRKHIRGHEALKRGNSVYIADFNTLNGQLCNHFLTRILTDRITIISNSSDADYTISSQSMDAFEGSFFEQMCTKDTPQLDDICAPLRVVLDEEIVLCAQHLGLSGKLQTQSAPSRQFIDALDKKYPGTKFAMGKSLAQLKDIQND